MSKLSAEQTQKLITVANTVGVSEEQLDALIAEYNSLQEGNYVKVWVLITTYKDKEVGKNIKEDYYFDETTAKEALKKSYQGIGYGSYYKTKLDSESYIGVKGPKIYIYKMVATMSNS